MGTGQQQQCLGQTAVMSAVRAAASKRVYSWRAVIWMNSWLEDRASRSSSPGVQSLFDALSRSLLPGLSVGGEDSVRGLIACW